MIKHCGAVNRPQVAYDYLNGCIAIDIHNHVRTGSVGLEDIWKTQSAHARQFAGVLGFVLTYAYLAYQWFKLQDPKCPVKLKNPVNYFHRSTTFQCSLCKIAICKLSAKRSCWNLHIEKGVPKTTYRKKQNKLD